jgi:hypothetical protein
VESKPARIALGTPRGLSATAGTLAVGAWLYERGIPQPSVAWQIDITLDHGPRATPRFAEAIDTRFQLFIRHDEWGIYFCHGGRVSRLRVTDLVRPELRDDHNLASSTPPLRRIGTLVRQLEIRYGVHLLRSTAEIATTVPETEPIVRAWLATL